MVLKKFTQKYYSIIQLLLSVLKAGLPQFLGLLTFISVIKMDPYGDSHILLPVLQAGMAISSIFFLGVAYTRFEYNINFSRYIIFLTVECVFYSAYSRDVTYESVLYFLTISSFGILQYRILILHNTDSLLVFNIFTSLFLPLTLLLNRPLLIIFSIVVFFTVYLILKNSDKNEIDVAAKISAIKSILIQSPFLIFPIFDELILQRVGVDNYKEYAITSKVMLGAGVFLFSHMQMSVLENKILPIKKIISIKLIMVAMVMFLGVSIIPINFVMQIQMMLLTLVLNIASLIVRSVLKSDGATSMDMIFVAILMSVYFYILYFGVKLYYINNDYILSLFLVFILIILWFRRRCINSMVD